MINDTRTSDLSLMITISDTVGFQKPAQRLDSDTVAHINLSRSIVSLAEEMENRDKEKAVKTCPCSISSRAR